MRNLTLIVAALAAVTALAQPQNVVIVLIDDGDYAHLAGRDSDRPGGGTPMPNLDALFAAGTHWPNGDASMSVCRPSLATIMSGQSPHTNGMRNNNSPGYVTPALSMSMLFHDAGFATYIGGKHWEPGPDGEIDDPSDYGYDAWNCVGTPDDGGAACFVRVTQAGLLAWIPAHATERKFIWWAPVIPHLPHNPPLAYQLAIDPNDVIVPPQVSPADEDGCRTDEAALMAMHAWFDGELGIMLDALDAIGQRDDTLFVLINDNGYRNGAALTKQTPGVAGHSVDIAFAGPGIVAQRFGEPVTGAILREEDILPTTLALAGVSDPFAGVRDGVSRADVCGGAEYEGPALTVRANYSRDPLPGDSSAPYESVLAVHGRTQQYHYIRFLRNVRAVNNCANCPIRWKHPFAPLLEFMAGDEVLCDIAADPWELTNLIDDPAHATALYELRRATLDEWWHSGTGDGLADGLGGDGCPEDRDYDGTVGLADLSILLGVFGQPSGDRANDLADLAGLLARFGESCR